MNIRVFSAKAELGAAAAALAAEALRAALQARGEATLVLATGTSQFETLAALVRAKDVDWSRVALFNLDEYKGMPATHPASLRKYLRERFIEKVGRLREVHLVEGDAPDPRAECERLGRLIAGRTIDVACIGIGVNGHLAFNDPPADFDTAEPYLVVELDEVCRRQQFGEGWFEALADVPRQGLTMSLRQILKSRRIVCSVPDRRKAEAVRGAVEGQLTNLIPAAILRMHGDATLLLDTESASLLKYPPPVVA